ncbi:MAG: hypothetical protein AAGI63_09240, partial [Planctomycetota bacterium]
MKTYCVAIICLMGISVGCTGVEDEVSVPQPVVATETVASPSTDDAGSVAMIESITDKVRRSGDNIIDVDFRGLQIDDTALQSLMGLPKLRAVRLAGTSITDEGLKTIGMIESLEDLDLRNCAVSDTGLAHLTSLKKLKALRLSGDSGDCTVSDDG